MDVVTLLWIMDGLVVGWYLVEDVVDLWLSLSQGSSSSLIRSIIRKKDFYYRQASQSQTEARIEIIAGFSLKICYQRDN